MHSVRGNATVIMAFGFALLSAPALAQPAPPAGGMPGMNAPPAPADRAMMDGMEKMNRAMSGAPHTGDPDRDFVAMMIPHHLGAVDMAKVELRYGKDPTLRRLAHDVVLAQEREIRAMHRWQGGSSGPVSP